MKKKLVMNKPIKAVIFDLGKVLVDFDWSVAVNRTLPHTPFSCEDIVRIVSGSSLLGAYEEGDIDTDEFCMGVIESLKADISIEEFTSFWTEIFIRRPKMEEIFQKTREHVPVAILSDTSPMHWNYIKNFVSEISNPDGLALSYEIGSRKPEMQNYLVAAASIKTPPENCLFFDDRPGNIDGALAAGLNAIVYTSEEDTKDAIEHSLGVKLDG
jgi:putative hydrolase of the HAD superfamily